MPVSVTATLLICVWAGRSVSQRRSELNTLLLCLPCKGRGVCSIVVERESEVRFVGAVSAEAKFSSCSLSLSLCRG